MYKLLYYILSVILICLVASNSFGQEDGDNSAISIVWTDQNSSVSIPTGSNGNKILSLIAGTDLDQDGLKEIIAVVLTSDVAVYRHLCVFEAAGDDNQIDLVWQYEFPNPISKTWLQNCCIGDLDGNGVLEIIAIDYVETPSNQPEIYVFEYSDTDNTYGIAGGTQPNVTWDMNTPDKAEDVRSIAVGDLNDDGKDELSVIVAMSQPAFFIASIDNFVYQNWAIEFATDEITYPTPDPAAITICDLDNDGHKEVAFTDLKEQGWGRLGFVEYEESEYKLMTVIDIGLPTGDYKPGRNALSARDFNGDGQEELYISCWAGALFYVVSLHSGMGVDNLSSYDVYLLDDTLDPLFLGCSVICDWDHGPGSDGMDYVVGGDRVTYSGEKLPEIYDWEYIGGDFGDVTDPENYKFYKLINEDEMVDLLGKKESLCCVACGNDLDGDGKNEIVFGRIAYYMQKEAIFVAEFSGSSPVIDTKNNLVLDAYSLLQNYPNPFNNSTVIEFSLKGQGKVSSRVYSLSGQEVVSLVDGEMVTGRHKVSWIPAELASGVYFYTISVNGFKQTRKLIFLK